MTTQTKQYIEVRDIVAIRCECKGCGSSLTLPVAKDIGKSILQCPRCGKGWTRLENSSKQIAVEEFADKANILASLMELMGFNLTLEIKGDSKA